MLCVRHRYSHGRVSERTITTLIIIAEITIPPSVKARRGFSKPGFGQSIIRRRSLKGLCMYLLALRPFFGGAQTLDFVRSTTFPMFLTLFPLYSLYTFLSFFSSHSSFSTSI